MYYSIKNRKSGELLRLDVYKDDEFTAYELNVIGDNIWITNNIVNAQKIFEIEYEGISYNEESPWSIFENSEIEIVELDVDILI